MINDRSPIWPRRAPALPLRAPFYTGDQAVDSMLRVFVHHPFEISSSLPTGQSSITPRETRRAPAHPQLRISTTPSSAVSEPPMYQSTINIRPPAGYTPITTPPPRTPIMRALKKNRLNFLYLGIVTLVLGGLSAGFAIWINVDVLPNPNAGWDSNLALIGGLFILAILIALCLFARQAFYCYLLMFPRSQPRTAHNTSEATHHHTIPGWVLPRPPTYREAVQGTGDIEDGIIAMSRDLPVYGDIRGSTLLMRSETRGRTPASARGGIRSAASGGGPDSAPAVLEVPEEAEEDQSAEKESVSGEEREDKEAQEEKEPILQLHDVPLQ